MLYTIHQLLFVSLIVGVAAAIIVWMVHRSRMLDLFRRKRTEVDAMLAWRAVEHENALVAAHESLRVSNEQRREAELRLQRISAETTARVGQYDETIANLHRNLRTHQDKLRDAQRRADGGDEVATSERRTREVTELRLDEARSKIEAHEAELDRLRRAIRGSDSETMMMLEQQVLELTETQRERDVRLKTALAAVGDRDALERRLVETQERLRGVERELSSAHTEATRMRVAHQAKSAVFEGRIRDCEREVEFAEARIDDVATEQATAHRAERDALQAKIKEGHRQLRIAREHIDERDEELDRLEEEIEVLRASAGAGGSEEERASRADLERRVEEGEAELAGLREALVDAQAQAEAVQSAAVEAQAALEAALEAGREELEALRGREDASEAMAASEPAAQDHGATQEMVEVRAALERVQAENERLEDELAEARAEILTAQALPLGGGCVDADALQEQLSESRTRIAELEAAAVLRAEVEQAAREVEQQGHASMEQALISAIDDLNVERDRAVELAQRLAASEAARADDTRGEALVRMEAQLTEAQRRLEEAGTLAQENLSADDEKLASWQLRIQDYEAQLRQMGEQMALQMGALNDLEGQLARAQTEQRAAQARAVEAAAEAAEATREQATLQAERAALTLELSKVREQCSAAQQGTGAEPSVDDRGEKLANRDQEREIQELRGQLERANQRIQAVTLLSEQEFDPHTADELQLIAGIGPVLERRLRDGGITSYRELALLDEAAIEELSGPLRSLRNRMRREHWIVQAKKLHLAKHGEEV